MFLKVGVKIMNNWVNWVIYICLAVGIFSYVVRLAYS